MKAEHWLLPVYHFQNSEALGKDVTDVIYRQCILAVEFNILLSSNNWKLNVAEAFVPYIASSCSRTGSEAMLYIY